MCSPAIADGCACVCARTPDRDWRAADHHNHDTLLAGIVNCPRITILCALQERSELDVLLQPNLGHTTRMLW